MASSGSLRPPLCGGLRWRSPTGPGTPGGVRANWPARRSFCGPRRPLLRREPRAANEPSASDARPASALRRWSLNSRRVRRYSSRTMPSDLSSPSHVASTSRGGLPSISPRPARRPASAIRAWNDSIDRSRCRCSSLAAFQARRWSRASAARSHASSASSILTVSEWPKSLRSWHQLCRSVLKSRCTLCERALAIRRVGGAAHGGRVSCGSSVRVPPAGQSPAGAARRHPGLIRRKRQSVDSP